MSKSPTLVLSHADNGRDHAVLAELRVLVAPGVQGGFIAQGLDIDYVASGATEEDARARFANGFVATVRAFIRRNRSLDGLFKTQAPAEARAAYFSGTDQHVFRCVLTEQLEDIPAGFAMPRAFAFISSPVAIAR
jgi:hypothetical protein